VVMTLETVVEPASDGPPRADSPGGRVKTPATRQRAPQNSARVYWSASAGQVGNAGTRANPGLGGSRCAARGMRGNSVVAKGRDVEAVWFWGDVVRQHSASVNRLAYRLTGNRHDADDLTQDVFASLLPHLSTSTRSAIESQLDNLAHELFVDQIRRKERTWLLALAVNGDERLAELELAPSDLLDDYTVDRDMQNALNGLTPDTRAVVVLSDIEGLSCIEIAGTLGMDMFRVQSHIDSGRAQLRVALAHRAPCYAGVTPTAET
jgi:RNA polymerase sigma factor (sigma-70 family)